MSAAGMTASDAEAAADAAAFAAWVQRGDRTALEGVFARHADAALRLAAQRLGNRSDAEDAVQHAFLGVMRRARHFRSDRGSARGYLLASVVNACAEQRRAAASRSARERIAAPPEAAEAGDPELRDVIRTALAELPDHQRRPVELRYLAGLDFPEIAAALSRNERTVRGQVTRGLAALREICGRLGVVATPAAIVVALTALPSPAPAADAVARCVGLAHRGPLERPRWPVAIALAGGVAALAIAVVALTHVRRVAPPAPPAGPVASTAPSPAAGDATPLDCLTPIASWYLPDDATTGDIPFVALGAARPAEDPAGSGAAWWRPDPPQQADRFTWGAFARADDVRPMWTPARLLVPARAGEEAYLVCVAPPARAGTRRTVTPLALVREGGVVRLTLEGLRVPETAFAGELTRVRGAFAFSVGRLPATPSRLEVDVAWRDMPTLRKTFPEAPAATSHAAAAITGAIVAAVPSPDESPGPDADPARWWQMPLSARVLPIPADDPDASAPAGLIAPEAALAQRCWSPRPGDAASVVLVLSPALAEGDELRLRTVHWTIGGAEVTVDVRRARAADDRARRRVLLPVWLARPLPVPATFAIDLVWRELVPDVARGGAVALPTPSFAPGTTRLPRAPQPPDAF